MKIKHLLDAIELDSLDPRRFSQHLVDAWQRVRFAKPVAGYAGSDAIGATLIGTNNFAWKSSGWFDGNGITFPADLLPKDRDQLRTHLEWMIDCRRDSDTIDYIHRAIRKQLPSPADATKSAIRRITLGELVTGLEQLHQTEPRLFQALLTGRLWKIRVWLRAKQDFPEKVNHINTILWMIIVWALFDLQIIAYRLFHAEWNPLDAGMESPENMTLESLEKIASEMSYMAKLATAGFQRDASINMLDPQLRAYIDQNGLLENALKTAARIGIDEAALQAGEFRREDLLLYLRYLERRLSKMLDAFIKRANRPRMTMVGYAHHAAGTSKARSEPKTGGARNLAIKQSTATVRFSAPAITALLYAVEGIVHALGTLPALGKIKEEKDGSITGSLPLLRPQQRTQLADALFTIYRDLFVRPVKNARDEIVTSEYHNYATEAATAVAEGRRDPGLEPLHPEWQAQPMKPLYGGVPAGRLLAQGVDPGHYEKDSQDPINWRPKRVSAERKADTRAIRGLPENAKARRHFRERAAQFDGDFETGVTARFKPARVDPPDG